MNDELRGLDVTEAVGAASKVLREKHPDISNSTIVRTVIAAAHSLRAQMRSDTAAAVAAERERIAAAIEKQAAGYMHPEEFDYRSGLRYAARIAREESADG